ncbi:Uncharacterised protein [BD1-7 clade bacterium]|uniref:Uncharacterized protein n=1 Tax=BD1-7 clade bacterium TaxID=2029982 RepID=A0A5S9Q618_9GAMM|nr:Uncharacterised protein [BD1-7 clade bacterium]
MVAPVAENAIGRGRLPSRHDDIHFGRYYAECLETDVFCVEQWMLYALVRGVGLGLNLEPVVSRNYCNCPMDAFLEESFQRLFEDVRARINGFLVVAEYFCSKP